MGKNMKHYKRDGTLFTGNTHKMPNGELHSGKTHGKTIVCPECNKVATVFHFSWSALGCQHCGTMVDKYDWKLL